MKKFKKVYIEITNCCNLQCDFCPQTLRTPTFMKKEFFEEILEQIMGYTEHVYLHVKGEPLLHPELLSFIELCAAYNYHVNLTTNGTLLKKAEDELLLKPALRQVNISLHSFDANAYKKTIDDYLGDIFSFAKKAVAAGRPLISLRLWNLEEEKMRAIAAQDTTQLEKNRHILEKIEKAFSLPYRIEETLLPGRGIRLAPTLFLHQAARFQWPDIDLPIINETGFCYGLRDQIGILADGTVVPCCLDGEGKAPLGNLHDSTFEDIVEGPRAKAIYEGFSGRKAVEGLCKRCGYRQRFNDKK